MRQGATHYRLAKQSPFSGLERNRQTGPRRLFSDPGAFQARQAKLEELETGGSLLRNLYGVRKTLDQSPKKGGVDRGGAKGLGKFKRVLQALEKVEGKNTNDAISKLVQEAKDWLDRDEKGKDKEDEVVLRKRQAAQAIVLHGKVSEKLRALQAATDWQTYDQALRDAETAIRNFQAASMTVKNPPQRRTGGDSDTYKIINNNGEIAFYFKPQAGEAVAEGWESVKGGGAPREVLVSEFGDQMKRLGFDFNVPKVTEVSLTSMDFNQGTNSQSTSLSGVVIDAIKGRHGTPAKDGGNVIDKLKGLTPNQVKAFKESIPTADVHNMVVLDLLTLNMDRHQGNVMFDMDMDDNGDVTPPTRLVPIDAGNMLPPESVFDKVDSFGNGQSMGMTVSIGTDTEVPAMGKNMLLQLPQAKKPFDQAMIDKILNLDPKKVVEGMKGSDGRRQGDMAGKIGDDTFQMVEESVHFLKLVVAQTPPPMVGAIGRLYGIPEGFKAFKTARRRLLGNRRPGQQLDETSLVALVAQATLKAQQEVQDELDYADLGGDNALREYGWEGFDEIPLPQKLDHLQRKTNNPAAERNRDKVIQDNHITKNDLPNDYDTMTLFQQLLTVRFVADELMAQAKINQRGGDNEIQRILAAIHQTGATAGLDRPDSSLNLSDKSLLLDYWDAFEHLGGYVAYNAAVVRGMTPDNTSLKSQKMVLARFQENEGALQAAEAGGGERTFNALKAAVARRNFTAKVLQKAYGDLSPTEKKEMVETYHAIKDLPAFRNYDQLVAQGELQATTVFREFVSSVKSYKPKG